MFQLGQAFDKLKTVELCDFVPYFEELDTGGFLYNDKLDTNWVQQICTPRQNLRNEYCCMRAHWNPRTLILNQRMKLGKILHRTAERQLQRPWSTQLSPRLGRNVCHHFQTIFCSYQKALLKPPSILSILKI